IVGGILGGIIGFVAGGIGILPGAGLGSMIGGGLGQLAGMGSGLQKEMEQQRGKQKAEILKMVTPFLDDCQRECLHILNEALKKTERTLRDELRSQIQREQQTCEKTLQTIQDARKLNQEQAARRVAELKVPLDTLSRIRKSIEDQ